jgi:transposase InsO family protein
MRQSMSRKSDGWDYACSEAFFQTLRTELIGRGIYRSREVTRTANFENVEVFYNPLAAALISWLHYTSRV